MRRLTALLSGLVVATAVTGTGEAQQVTAEGKPKDICGTALRSFQEVVDFINRADPKSKFIVPVADELWNDPPDATVTGLNAALITDAALRRGLMPSGSVQQRGCVEVEFKPFTAKGSK